MPSCVQARHQDRRRQQQDLLARVGVVGRHDHLLELEPGELRQQPAAQRPRRIVLAADGQRGLGHDRGLLVAARTDLVRNATPCAHGARMFASDVPMRSSRWLRKSRCPSARMLDRSRQGAHDLPGLPGALRLAVAAAQRWPSRRCPRCNRGVATCRRATRRCASSPPPARCSRWRRSRTRGRPSASTRVQVGEREVAVREEVGARARRSPRCCTSARTCPTRARAVLIVAPMSGHFATLLRDTARTMLADHDVYITDWHNARDVPLLAGRFGLDEYIEHVIDFLARHRPGRAPGGDLPALRGGAGRRRADGARTSIRRRRASLTLMAGPIDCRIAPTEVNKLATDKPIDMVRAEPDRHRAAALPRRDAPRLSGLPAADGVHEHEPRPPPRVVSRALRRSRQRRDREGRRDARRSTRSTSRSPTCRPSSISRPCSTCSRSTRCRTASCKWRGRTVDPAAIRRTALLTVEGERDDICSLGQTLAAHDLCTGLRPYMKTHYVQAGVRPLRRVQRQALERQHLSGRARRQSTSRNSAVSAARPTATLRRSNSAQLSGMRSLFAASHASNDCSAGFNARDRSTSRASFNGAGEVAVELEHVAQVVRARESRSRDTPRAGSRCSAPSGRAPWSAPPPSPRRSGARPRCPIVLPTIDGACLEDAVGAAADVLGRDAGQLLVAHRQRELQLAVRPLLRTHAEVNEVLPVERREQERRRHAGVGEEAGRTRPSRRSAAPCTCPAASACDCRTAGRSCACPRASTRSRAPAPAAFAACAMFALCVFSLSVEKCSQKTVTQ